MKAVPEQRVSVERLRVASPCPASWGTMRGDERTRFCEQCQRHVYNISAMTRREVEALVHQTEGSFCARLYRRADGTVLTKDCPVGLRALRRRAAKVAGAAATALLSLCVSALGRTATGNLRAGVGSGVRGLYNQAEISGRALDPMSVPVEGATVTLTNLDTGKKVTQKTGAQGKFRFSALAPGRYQLMIEASDFETYVRDKVLLGHGATFQEDIILSVGLLGVINVMPEPPVTYRGPGTTTVFSGDKVRKLPF